MKIPAALAVGTLLATGSVVASAPEPAHADWREDASTWISTMETGLGWANKLFGVDVGPWTTALSLAGPLISAVFGNPTADPKPPTIDDVLTRLKKLDDIEAKIDQVQSRLDTIEAEVIGVGQDVLVGTCTVQASRLGDYLTKLEIAQDQYRSMVDHIDELRVKGGDGRQLKILIDEFITYTTGDATHLTPGDSAFAESLRGVHTSMMTTGGVAGVIQSCGRAYFNDWKVRNASPAALKGMPDDHQGAWLDDRAYYEPLQKLVAFWQTAVGQGTYLHQQASLMRATKEYVAANGSLSVEDSQRVCALARTSGEPKSKTICESAHALAQVVYNNFAAEWREVGLPVSDENVVMSLGTDVHGATYQPTVPRGPRESTSIPLKPDGEPVSVPSRVWARNPSTFPATWTHATWSTTAEPITAYGVAGFAPAGSREWTDLNHAYRATHPASDPVTLEESSPWREPSGYQNSGVSPHAPLDILAAMSDSTAPAVGDAVPAHPFSFDRNATVWLPNETAAHDFPMWVAAHHDWGSKTGLSFPPSRYWAATTELGYMQRAFDESPMSVKCFVAARDGIVCNETVGAWWVNRLQINYDPSQPTSDVRHYAIIPVSRDVDPMYIRPDQHGCSGGPASGDRECANSIGGFYGPPPAWLAPITARDGQRYEGDPTATATLWPSAPIPACPNTSWGAHTRCGTEMDAWIRATVPNPSLDGPVAARAPSIQGSDTQNCVPNGWQEGTSSNLRFGDVTWTAWTADFTESTTMVLPFDERVNFVTLAETAGWGTRTNPGKATMLNVECSFTARTAEVANTSVLKSDRGVALRDGDGYIVVGPEETPPGAEPGTDPSPGASAPGSLPAGSGPGQPIQSASGTPQNASSGAGSLAATGTVVAPWTWTAGGLVLAALGILILLTGRRARRWFAG